MDRVEWLKQRRLWNEVQMDTIYARRYDERWGASINDTHQRMVERLLSLCPPHARILDAACGTGKYWTLLLTEGRTIVGADQSRGMLERAHAKFPSVPVEQVALQDLSFSDAFDAVICIDAMEIVFPEDWPLVLAHFARALHTLDTSTSPSRWNPTGSCASPTRLVNVWDCHLSTASMLITAAIITIPPTSRRATGSRRRGFNW